MVFKPSKDQSGQEETWRERLKRLEALRQKQGDDIEHIKNQFELDFHLNEAKALEINGVIDK